jgi:sensor histidine kinase regulating citrate/malate metabolism
MFNRLRTRFVLSHILPLLVIIPLMGLALIYVLETQVLLENLSSELEAQASLAAEIMRGQQDIWIDPQAAQTIVSDLQTRVEARVMLLDAGGILLASSDPADTARLGSLLEAEGVSAVLAGETSVRATYSRTMRNEIVDVLVPVMSDEGRVAGAVRMSHHLLTVSERFGRLRYLIGGVLAGGLVLGGIVGWALALSLERPLKQVTSAISQLATGEQTEMLKTGSPRSGSCQQRSTRWWHACAPWRQRGGSSWRTWYTSWDGRWEPFVPPARHCWGVPGSRPS